MGVQFVHLLALSLWVGGIVVVEGIVRPILSHTHSSSPFAGPLLGKILLRFDRTTLFCAGALIATGIVKFWQWENLTPWNLIRYCAIALMSFLSFYTALKISPNRLEEALHPHSKSTVEAQGKRDRLSARLMRINLICGTAALLLA